MAIIGGILVFAAGIASLIFWIMSLVKAFKAGETVWGVLSIFFPIVGLIFFFVKGPKKLGIYWIVAVVVMIIGYAILMPGLMAQAQEMQQTMPQ